MSIDSAALLDRVDGDLELLEELISIFLTNSPAILGQIESAVARGDLQAIERSAHSLKGSLLNLCAASGAAAALELENAGRVGDLARAGSALAILQAEWDQTRNDLISQLKGA